MRRCFRDRLLDYFYPARCPVCDKALAVGRDGICETCTAHIEYIREPKCYRCGKPLTEEDEFCNDCKRRKYSFRQGNALLLYDGMMQESVARFKYGGRREYGRVYAQELYRHYGRWVRQIGAGMLIPVPVHRSRLQTRGYNQAEIIAKHLADYCGIEMRNDMLIRIKATQPQKELSAAERLKNLEGAFRPGRGTEVLNRLPECVIIIDDIYTTGSTLEACSKVLREIGIDQIYFLCVCIGKGS